MTTERTTRRRGPDPRAIRSSFVAILSCVVVFGGVAWIVVNAPGWPAVQTSFFNGEVFAETLPGLVESAISGFEDGG